MDKDEGYGTLIFDGYLEIVLTYIMAVVCYCFSYIKRESETHIFIAHFYTLLYFMKSLILHSDVDVVVGDN